ncbi:hypothetical protein Mal64_13180 [Pseudobythopirellula maris]|uniref:Uncharacterized protein n=1 Tax=Pseudobythopirellula maris TaxID=2527991 RepID=A0A5C5ZU12_9BACT|nr:hypothetical protein Mal64_13180 [Pseudobythopirellula maris]
MQGYTIAFAVAGGATLAALLLVCVLFWVRSRYARAACWSLSPAVIGWAIFLGCEASAAGPIRVDVLLLYPFALVAMALSFWLVFGFSVSALIEAWRGRRPCTNA